MKYISKKSSINRKKSPMHLMITVFWKYENVFVKEADKIMLFPLVRVKCIDCILCKVGKTPHSQKHVLGMKTCIWWGGSNSGVLGNK